MTEMHERGRGKSAPKRKDLSLNERDFELLAVLAGHKGEPLKIMGRLKTVPPEQLPSIARSYIEGIDFLRRNQGVIKKEALMQAAMSGAFAEGQSMLALSETLMAKVEPDKVVSTFVDRLFVTPPK